MIWEWRLAQSARRGCESPFERAFAAGAWAMIEWCPGDWPFNEGLVENRSLICRFVGEGSLRGGLGADGSTVEEKVEGVVSVIAQRCVGQRNIVEPVSII